jgi:hypothetical protein
MLAVVGILLAGTPPVRAQEMLLQRNYDTEGKTRIEVSAVFSPKVSRGYLPVRVTIRNATALDRTWNLTFQFGGGWNEMAYRSSFAVRAAAGAEAIHELLVPVPTTMNSGSTYRQIEVSASSAGLPSEQNFNSSNLNTEWPSLAMSRDLAQRNLTSLNSEVSSLAPGTETFAAAFNPADLPAEWRGYSGLDGLLMTEEEWTAASPDARLAILEWTRLGGRLDLYTRRPNPAEWLAQLDLGAVDGPKGSVSRSLGSINAWTWNGQDLNAKSTAQRYRPVGNLAKSLGDDYKSGWSLHSLFGTKSFNPLLVVLLLIAFGVVVGPVNLFILAKPGRRHRLFITTPIISLVASLLILALILFSDGIGGSGRRIALVNLEPAAAEKRLYVTQEQISRTGVLLGTAFDAGDPVFVSPVMIPPSEWNRLTTSRNPIASYSLIGQVYRGDWYQSRSEQGHFLQAVLPTRSRIELQAASPDGEAPPKLFSSLEFTVSELFYRDELGMVWKAAGGAPVSGGQAIELAPVDFTELQTWWRDQIAPLSQTARLRAASLWKGNGRFFAISSDPRAGFIGTLDSIRWADDIAVIHGPVLPAAGPAPQTAPAN